MLYILDLLHCFQLDKIDRAARGTGRGTTDMGACAASGGQGRVCLSGRDGWHGDIRRVHCDHTRLRHEQWRYDVFHGLGGCYV